jgi:hypothetical protein
MKPLYDRKFHIPVIYRFLTFLSRKFRKYFDCISSQPLSGHKNNIDSYTRTIKIIILRKESWNYDGQQLNQEAAMVIEVGFTTTNVLMQSVPITTKFVSLNPTNGEVYSIQHYVIKFLNDLHQVVCFFSRLLRFPPSIKLTATI